MSVAMQSCACLALTVLATAAQGAPCNMDQLMPILDSPDMQQCRQETGIKIPAFGYDGISPYSIGTEECENPSCGKAITAIKALKLSECDLDTQFCSRSGCETVKTSLYHNHLDVIDAKCPNGLNVNATKPPAASNVMDSSVKCTEEGLRAAVWDVRTSIESCLGVKLSELVDQRNENRTVEDMESLMACYRCSNLTTEIQQLKGKLPTCQLAFGVSFSDFLMDNAEFCTAKADYERGNLANEWLIKRVMNSSQLCGYQKLYTYFNPSSSNQQAPAGLFDENACPLTTSARYAPVQPTPADREATCSHCKDVAFALGGFAVPNCLLPFNMTYREYVRDLYNECEPSIDLNTTLDWVLTGGEDGGINSISDKSVVGSRNESDLEVSTPLPSFGHKWIASSVVSATLLVLVSSII